MEKGWDFYSIPYSFLCYMKSVCKKKIEPMYLCNHRTNIFRFCLSQWSGFWSPIFFALDSTLCNLCTRAYLSIFKVASSQQLISFAGERMSMTWEPKCVSSYSGWARIEKKCNNASGCSMRSNAKTQSFLKFFLHSKDPFEAIPLEFFL